MVANMTEGNVFKVLLKFTVPMLLSVIFQQFYNIVDSIIAGNFINENALGAVGASYPVTMLFIAFATGLGMGSTVVVSKYFGAGKNAYVKSSASTALISMLVFSLLLTVFGLIFYSDIITALKTPENIFQDSKTYLRIYILGLFFLFLYNGCNSVFTALGDSRTPLFFLIMSSLGNILLDILFVVCFKWGVSGIGWATFIAQCISAVLSFTVLLRRISFIHTSRNTVLYSFKLFRQILHIAIPSIIQHGFVSVGNMLIQSLVNSFGGGVISGYAAAIKLNTFALTCFTAISNSISSYTAQNLGAKRLDRVISGIKVSSAMILCVTLPFILVYFFLSEPSIKIFLPNPTADMLEAGTMFLKIASPFYIAVSFKIVIDGTLRGAGVMLAFTISTISDYIVRIIFAYALSARLGSNGIWLSWPASWIIGLLISFAFFASGKWKKPYIS